LYCISPVADMTYIERSARTVGAVSRSFLSARFSVGRRCIATEQYRVSFLILIKKTQSRLSAVICCSVISHDGAEVAVRRLVRNSYIIFIYLFIFCNFTYVWSLSAPPPPTWKGEKVSRTADAHAESVGMEFSRNNDTIQNDAPTILITHSHFSSIMQYCSYCNS